MRRIFIVMVATSLAAGTALAEPVSGRAAKDALFSARKSEVVMAPAPFLSDSDARLLASVVADQPYYGAVAVAPDEGLASEATFAAANHHSVEAAVKAALAACNAKRKGGRPCAIVGNIRPEGWQPRGFGLSADATKGFRDDYGSRGSRALAISPSTGRWGLGKGDRAASDALAACGKGGAGDCQLAVAD